MNAGPSRRAALLGLLLFLAVLLPLRLARAGAEQSLWIDETASFMLASHPFSVILDQCAVDTNPPGYFFVLKTWIKLGKILLREPGILWARSLGTVVWLLFAVALWTLGRSWAPGAPLLLLAAVAGSAYAAVAAQDARGYCLAVPGLSLAFLLLLDLYAHPTRPRPAQRARWSLVGLALAIALWSHLLAALVFVLLALLFAGLALRRPTREFAGYGTLALALAALSFVPWSLKIGAGIGSLQASAVTWMTPATVPNLLSVFYYWYPFGRVGGPGRYLLDGLGAASLLLPLAAAFFFARPKTAEANPFLRLAAVSGLGLALTFVTLLWLLHRLGITTVFYAPRYPALTAGPWAAGLACLALSAAERARRPRALAWLLLAPWLLASVAGQVWALFAERRGGLQEMRAHFAPELPAPGDALYVMPSELIPFFRRTLAEFRVRPIEALPCDLAQRRSATVLDLNFWHLLDRPRDLIARTVLKGGTLAARLDTATFPDWRNDYAVYRLEEIHPEKAEALCRRGLGPSPRPIPPAAVAVALPEDQEYQGGWSFPEVAPDLTIRRWASRATAEILVDRPLPPGAYLFHLQGYNPAYPSVPARISVEIPAGKAAVSRTFAEGAFTLDLPLTLETRRGPLRVRLTRATWSPKTATGAPDARVLSLLFEYAWIEQVPRRRE